MPTTDYNDDGDDDGDSNSGKSEKKITGEFLKKKATYCPRTTTPRPIIIYVKVLKQLAKQIGSSRIIMKNV